MIFLNSLWRGFGSITVVQMATLSVHEAMGFKVDREAVATLVLPQLWAMSMGPRTFPFFVSHER